MQHAKKLVIVNPRLLDQLQVDREYKHIQRPANALAKTSLSLEISRILQDSIPENVKAPQYQDALRRYYNVKSIIPQEIKTEPNPIQQPRQVPLRSPSPPPPLPPPLPPPPVHLPRPRRRYRSPSPPPVRRHLTRYRRPPSTGIPWVAY